MTADGKKTKEYKIIKKIHIFVRIILSISLFVDIYVLRQGSFVFHLFFFSWECLDSEPTIQPHDGGGKRPLVRPSAFFFIHFHPLVFHSFEQFIQLIQLVYQPFSFIPFPFAMIQLLINSFIVLFIQLLSFFSFHQFPFASHSFINPEFISFFERERDVRVTNCM